MHLGRTQVDTGSPAADPQVVRVNKLELVERLADDLAHEIKNPLHSMVINLEVLKRRITRLEASPSEDLLRYVGVLGGELDRVSRRVELLLRMVRPDRGNDPATLDEVVAELLELLELERERRGVVVDFEPAAVLVQGHLSRDVARQMVLNLLLAALDALPSGGRIGVRTEVESDWTRLHIQGRVPEANDGIRPPVALDGAARLAVARALSEVVGGRLEVAPRPDREAGEPSSPVFSLVLSLPLTVD